MVWCCGLWLAAIVIGGFVWWVMKSIPFKTMLFAANFLWAWGNLFAQSPSSEAHAAYLDCAKVRAEAQPGCRYFTLYAVPKERRAETAKVLSYTLNALSRSRVITAPVWVSDTLARFSLVSYAPTAQEYIEWQKAWESLGQRDTSFGIITEIIDPTTKKFTITRVDGGWLPNDYQKLKAATATNAPILRADWFIYHALTTPSYYQFAGVPATEGEFLKSLGLDAKVIAALRANSGANLQKSGVTYKPRRVVWSQGPLGGVYVTYDGEKVDAERDPFRRPIDADGLRLAFDATEWFAMQPNGLWRMALYDAKGKQQQTVPDKIAKDTSDPHSDGIVIPALSCIRCHVEAGLRPFSDDQTRLLAKAPIGSYRPDYSQRVNEFYDEPRLQRQMDFDRQTYTAACAKATGGMTPKELAEALTLVARHHAYLPLTVDDAAREVGQTADDFKRANINSNDPHIITLIHGGEALRGSWESSFAAAAVTAEAWRIKK